ncbi:hypothetical protein GDO81_012002 [Engystomops pustulosus]|uniref:FBA domain-containing protein n=1 Tax=Engystomops pustulosus TaxID=76066 RepID=A0AAV7BIZ8_ENGPU|nr:hypothetical protein GDO81_012002 [Engystomops pustulosus]
MPWGCDRTTELPLHRLVHPKMAGGVIVRERPPEGNLNTAVKPTAAFNRLNTHDHSERECYTGVSAVRLCSKTQEIDLLKEGYTEEVLDAQPNIVVSDWYAARTDAGCLYELKVKLLSDSRDVISEYNSENITIPEKTDGSWNQVILV